MGDGFGYMMMDSYATLATRRSGSAASALLSFPPLTLPTRQSSDISSTQKYPSPAPSPYDTNRTRFNGDGLSPMSSGLNSSSSQSSQAGSGSYYQLSSYSPGQWPTPGHHGGNAPSLHEIPSQGPHNMMPVPNFNSTRSSLGGPMPSYPGRSTSSAGPGDPVSASPYHPEGLGSYSTSSHLSSGRLAHDPAAGSHATTAATQHMHGSSLASPDSVSHGQSPVTNMAEGYRAPTLSTYSPYPSGPASQLPSYSNPYSAGLPTSLSYPSTTTASSRSILSAAPHQSSAINAPLSMGYSNGRSSAVSSAYGYHSHSGNPGMVMSNMGNPGQQMALLNGMNGGMSMPYHHSGHHMSTPYGMPQTAPHQDRPFKCETCHHAFNRNHDLKRHKRIHLAVKPFPCNICDKSFSRKDALKRHRLVKGCGNKMKEMQRSAASRDAMSRIDEGSESMPPEP